MGDAYRNNIQRCIPNRGLTQKLTQTYLKFRQDALRQPYWRDEEPYGRLYIAYGKPLLFFDASGCTELNVCQVIRARAAEQDIVDLCNEMMLFDTDRPSQLTQLREIIMGSIQMATPDIWQGAEDLRDNWEEVYTILRR